MATAPASAPGAKNKPDDEDFLSQEFEGYEQNSLAEQIIEGGADAMMAMYRLAKIMMVHDAENQAVKDTVALSRKVLAEYSELVGGRISFTFVYDAIFVCGELLKAPRGVYESAAELMGLFSRCQVSEVAIEGAATEEDLLKFGKVFSAAVTSPRNRGALLSSTFENVQVREVANVLQARDDELGMPVRERVLRLYASALVVLRAFYDAIAEGRTPTPVRLKRVAQKLVTLAGTGDPALLGMTTMANAHRDDAGRALQSAILAVSIGRQVTRDRIALAHLCLAAMVTDVGRARVLGPDAVGRLVPLTPAQNQRVPAASAAVCIANGGVNGSSAERVVMVFETAWLERASELGPPYAKRLPVMVQSRILGVVRLLLDEIAPRDAKLGRSPFDALHNVLKHPDVDKVMRRILVAALGLVPTGTVIEFSTGQWGVVVGPSANPRAVSSPRVRIITDRTGVPLESPVEYDLGKPQKGRVFPEIVRMMDPSQAGFNATHAFLSDVGGGTAGRG
jgi:hypothetical protein